MGSPGNEKFTGANDNRHNLCFIEQRKKEIESRFAWFEKYYDICYGNLPKEQVPKGAKILWEAMAKRRAEIAQTAPNFAFRKKEPLPLPERDKTVILDTMKPVPPEVRELIYQGISHEGEGRVGYLKVRYKENPNDKFYMPDCTNWDYGWAVNTVELHKLIRIPRVQLIQSFYRRGGVERDPDHYREAAKREAPIFFPQI